MHVSVPSSAATVLTTPSSLRALRSCTRFAVSLSLWTTGKEPRIDKAVRYVQTGNKIEQILQAIRDAVHSGVEFAEDKLGQVLEVSQAVYACGSMRARVVEAEKLTLQLLTSTKLTAEQKYEKAKASVSSVYEVAITSASNYANTAAASATSAASVASASAS
jgi:hypothetical protein